MIDLLVVSVPVLDLQYPPSSPAIIKACAKSAGFSARTLDLNLAFKNICQDLDKFYSVQYNFENVGPDNTDTKDHIELFYNSNKDLITTWIDQSIAAIVEHNPVWLGISVFSYKSHKATLSLCIEIKKRHPEIKIVLGGRGANSYALGPDHSQFRKKMFRYFGHYPNKNFAETLFEYNLVDAVIQGDGEQAIIDLLSGSKETIIHGQVETIKLESLPFVDFDDYDLSAYEYINEPTIPITGSKGCVRQCTFCDIPVLWPKFKFRSGTHIAEEMIYLYNKHGVRKFYMSDSLVNGSLKAFKDFTKTLALHNQNNPDATIKWVGQYITRPISKEVNDDYYTTLKASGGEGLTIGVESGSDAVRAHMKKQFTTADIDYEIEQFDQKRILCVLLFFSCYPTETWQDFLETVNMFVRYQKYCASGTVWKITLGTPYTHHKQTPLWNMQDDIELTIKPGSDILWLLKENPTLTFKERIRRRLILQEVATALRLPMSRNTAELNQLIDSLRLHKQDINEFFKDSPVESFDDVYELIGTDKILMPMEIQEQIKTQLDQHPEYVDQILKHHANTNDDIKFDNAAYTILKQMIL